MLRSRSGLPQNAGKAFAVEDVIAQHHGARIVADEFLAQQEGLRQSVGGGLHLIGQLQPELTAVPQQRLKARRVGGCGDNQNILDPRQHQRGQGIVDHGLIVHGQQLLARDHGQGIQARSRAASQNNTLHVQSLVSYA